MGTSFGVVSGLLEILLTYHLSRLNSHNICIMDLMRPDLCGQSSALVYSFSIIVALGDLPVAFQESCICCVRMGRIGDCSILQPVPNIQFTSTIVGIRSR